MKNPILTMFTTLRARSQKLSARISDRYFALLRWAGVEDTEAVRVFCGVSASILLYYACLLLDFIFRVVSSATGDYSNIVHF